eukprot:403368242
MSNYHIPDPLVRAENDQKDLIIAQLKAEAFELRQKDRDYRQLHEQYLSVKHKYQQLVDEKKRNETELQSRIEYQFSASRSMKREAEDLRVINEDLQNNMNVQNYQNRRRKGEDLSIDQQGLHRLADDKQQQLETIKLECQRKSDITQSVSLDAKDKERELFKSQDEVKQTHSQNEVLRAQNASKHKKLECLQRDNAQFSSEAERIALRNRDLLNEIEGKHVQERRLEQEIREKQAQLQDYKERISLYEKNTHETERKLQNENIRSEEIVQRLRTLKQQLDETEEKLRRSQNRRREIQSEMERNDRENQELRRNKARLDDDQIDLRDQINAMNKHCDLLAKQNDELAQELQLMVETDELVRERLNRRERVLQIRNHNEDQLLRSRVQMERSKSPTNTTLQENLLDTIFLIRHGQRADQVYQESGSAIGYENKADPPMSKIGVQQVISTAKYLNDFILNLNKSQKSKLDLKIFTSPFLSCVQTAELISQHFDIKDVSVEIRLSENLADFKFEKDPIPDLVINDNQKLKSFMSEKDPSKALHFNQDWYEHQKCMITYPEQTKDLKQRFVGELNHIIEKEFDQDSKSDDDNVRKEYMSHPKTVFIVCHGVAFEQLCEHFGGRWQYQEDACAIVGFIRRKGEEQWIQGEQAGKAYYDQYMPSNIRLLM